MRTHVNYRVAVTVTVQNSLVALHVCFIRLCCVIRVPTVNTRRYGRKIIISASDKEWLQINVPLSCPVPFDITVTDLCCSFIANLTGSVFTNNTIGQNRAAVSIHINTTVIPIDAHVVGYCAVANCHIAGKTANHALQPRIIFADNAVLDFQLLHLRSVNRTSVLKYFASFNTD